MAGTIQHHQASCLCHDPVSMESGLDGRNNQCRCGAASGSRVVSMESGLDGRNNRLQYQGEKAAREQSQWSPA